MAEFNASFKDVTKFNASFKESGNMNASFGQVQIAETGDYNPLTNHPFINGFEVIGDKLGKDYKLQDLMTAITEQDIDNMMFG